LYFYFSGLPLRKAAESCCRLVLSNETMYHMELTASKIQTTKDIIKRKKINEFVIDETLIKEVGSSEYIWLWVAIEEPGSKRILDSGYQKSKICL